MIENLLNNLNLDCHYCGRTRIIISGLSLVDKQYYFPEE